MTTSDIFKRSISPQTVPDKPLRPKPAANERLLKSPGFGNTLAESFYSQQEPTRNSLYHGHLERESVEDEDVLMDADHIILTDTDVSVASVTPRMHPFAHHQTLNGVPLANNVSLQISERPSQHSKPQAAKQP